MSLSIEEDFESQLPDIQEISGSVEVDGVNKAYTLSLPMGNLASTSVILVMNGFAASLHTMDGFRTALAKEGYAAITMEPSHKSNYSLMDQLFRAAQLHIDQVDKIFDALPDNHELIDSTINGYNLDFNQISFAAHSHGSHIAYKYSLKNPGNISDILMMDPVGQEGHAALFGFARRMIPFVGRELLPYTGRTILNGHAEEIGDNIRHLLSIPTVTIGEALDCITAKDPLEALAPHIGTAILEGSSDLITPHRPIEAAAKGVHYYRLLQTGHLGPIDHADLVAHESKLAFESLAQRRHLTLVR